MRRPAARGLGALTFTVLVSFPRVGWSDIAVSSDKNPMVLTDNASAKLTATAGGKPLSNVQWHTQIGRIDDDGQFRGADRRAPAFAIVVASAINKEGKQTHGAMVLPLVGSGFLPTTTSPGASVRIDVAGKTFGPAIADKDGKATISVEVPPTVTQATVIAVGQRNRMTTKTIALPSRPFPLVLVTSPKTPPVGAKTQITVYAITKDGKWRSEQAPLRIRGDNVQVHSFSASGPGRWHATVEAKTAGRVTLTLSEGNRSLATFSMMAKATANPVVAFQHFSTVRAMGARVGLATTLDNLMSPMVTIELMWPVLRLGDVPIGVLVEVSAARGERDPGQRNSSTIMQFHLAGGAIARWPLGKNNAVDARLGLGVGAATANVEMNMIRSTENSLASLFFAAVGYAHSVGPGALIVDLRWTHVVFDDSLRAGNGSALGLVVSAGYQLRF